MKRLVFSMLVLGIMFFSFADVSAAPADANSNAAAGEKKAAQAAVKVRKAADTNSTADVNKAAGTGAGSVDANAVIGANDPNSKGKVLDELNEAIERLDNESQEEMRLWLQSSLERRNAVIKAVQDQFLKELDFIRDIAVEENAMRTAQAIDRLIEARKQREERLLQRTDEEKRRARLEEKEREKERLREQKRREIEEKRARTEMQRNR